MNARPEQNTFERTFEKKTEQFMSEHRMVTAGQTIIAGVSGGSDSMVMLHVLRKLQARFGYTLRVVHVDHGIRGLEAREDAAFVETYCRQQGISCRVVSREIPKLAREWGVGEEEAGRRVRKEAFAEERAMLGLPVESVRIALAHNENDVAETVVHNLARGTGLRGIASMRPVSGEIIRPLLGMSKQEILRYAKQANIVFREDCTNASDEYTRNRIRHRILPELTESVNAGAVRNLARTAEAAAEAVDYLEAEAAALLEQQPRLEEGFLLREAFWQAPKALRSFAIRRALVMLCGRSQDLEWEHVQMVEAAWELQTGRHVMLPYQVEAWKNADGVWLRRCVEAPSEKPPKPLQIPGETLWKNHRFTARLFPYEGQEITEKKYTKWFDYDKIKSALTVRVRKPDDQMRITKDGRHKTVRRILIDAKIPSVQRASIPLIAAADEVLWVPGIRMSEGFRITEETRVILEIKYQGGEQNE